MAVTRTWKVYGREGHRIKASFGPSVKYDWSNDAYSSGTRIFEVDAEDITGTNDYVIVRITRDSAELCERELEGQISDGFFENMRTGFVEEIS